MSLRLPADKAEICGNGGEITGDENNGIGLFEPRRQKNDDVGEQKPARCIKRPIQFVEDRNFTDEKLRDQYGVYHRNEEKHAAVIDTGMGSLIRRIGRVGFILRQLGVIDDRAAK